MPQYPKNKLAQQVIASCVKYKITNVVISPGSRNAPLTIGFSNTQEIKTYSIVDERCAAFFALGIAQQTKNPVALVCSSGSALLNYYPAIAEAYYSDIPLVVLSADRPKHLIDIGDGQTIRQENVFKNHILYQANLQEKGNNLKEIKKALQTAIEKKGAVHINIPFDEPLYEVTTSLLKLKDNIEEEKEVSNLMNSNDLKAFASIWNKAKKKIVLIGANYPNKQLAKQLNTLAKDPSVLVLTENTANISNDKFISSIDKLIFPFSEEELNTFRPDILLTLGGMIVSKKIKQHLRKYPPKHHWHIDVKRAYDSYHCLSHHFKAKPTTFFTSFFPLLEQVKSNYQHFWLQKKKERVKKHEEFLKTTKFSDLKAIEIVLETLPEHTQLQVANSSIIRYTQLFDTDATIPVFCNRGTSGIDGSTSTAVGAAVANKKQTIFITGDISFFYDSNALWNAYIPNNFRIILINNGGGGIFRFIPGPKKSNALAMFETPHNLSAKHLCTMYNINYNQVSSIQNLKKELATFYNSSKTPKLLEIKTPREYNDKVLKQYFNTLK